MRAQKSSLVEAYRGLTARQHSEELQYTINDGTTGINYTVNQKIFSNRWQLGVVHEVIHIVASRRTGTAASLFDTVRSLGWLQPVPRLWRRRSVCAGEGEGGEGGTSKNVKMFSSRVRK